MKPYILIGEFDPARLETWTCAAEAEGLETVACRDGDEVIRHLRGPEPPAMLVCGLSLPRADGFEVVAELRRRHDAAEVPALVSSPFRRLELAARARAETLGIEVFAGTPDVESAAAAIRRLASRMALDVPHEDPAAQAAREGRRETTRLRRVEAMDVESDLPHEPTLQRIVEDCARALHAPIAVLSVVLQDRTRFLAHVGLERLLAAEPQAEAEWPFCRHVTETGHDLAVPDASTNPAFAGNRLVKDGHVKSYAGSPVVSPGGEVVGALAVASTDRLTLGAAGLDTLGAFARRVAGELEIRAAMRRSAENADTFGSALGANDSPSTLMATLATARTALDSVDSGVILSDPQRRVVYVNPAACVMLGASASRLVGLTREQLVEIACGLVEDPDDFLRRIRVPPSGPYVGRAEFTFERPVRRTVRWVSRPVLLPSGLGQLALLSDVSAERELVEERRRFACTDPLTGLPNRRDALVALSREIGRANRTGQPLCMGLFDVAGLRFVNRDRGNAAGDRLLRAAAEALGDAVRAGDVVARWSGEEFLVLLPECGVVEARSVAERAARNLDAPELEASPGTSLLAGLVERRTGEDADAVLYRAEVQLREARMAAGAG